MGSLDGCRVRSYQWLADGEVISGEIGSTFAPTAAELGKKISVGDHRDEVQPGPTHRAERGARPRRSRPGRQPDGARPERHGSRGCQTLSSTDGTWTPGGTTFSYQWKADGTAIIGAAVGPALHTPAAAQVGQDHHGSRPPLTRVGFTDLASSKSTSTAAVDPVAVTNTVKPTIAATAAVGVAAQGVDHRYMAAGSGVAFTYQWLADGAANLRCDRRRRSRLRHRAVRQEDLCSPHRLQGLPLRAMTRTASRLRLSPTRSSTTRRRRSGVQAGRGRDPVEGTDGDWSPTPTDISYVWKSGGAPIGGESHEPAGGAGRCCRQHQSRSR